VAGERRGARDPAA